MTENQNSTTTEGQTDAVAETTEETTEQETQGRTGNPEAAKYRKQLREAEGQRDALLERVAGLQRAQVEQAAAATLAKPGSLWASGVQLADLLDAAGEVDQVKVADAARSATEDFGLATAVRTPRPDPTQGAREVAAGNGWVDAMGRSA